MAALASLKETSAGGSVSVSNYFLTGSVALKISAMRTKRSFAFVSEEQLRQANSEFFPEFGNGAFTPSYDDPMRLEQFV